MCRATALKYGDVNTVTPSPGEVKGLINDDNWVKIINKKNERKRYFNIKYDLQLINLNKMMKNNYLELDNNNN